MTPKRFNPSSLHPQRAVQMWQILDRLKEKARRFLVAVLLMSVVGLASAQSSRAELALVGNWDVRLETVMSTSTPGGYPDCDRYNKIGDIIVAQWAVSIDEGKLKVTSSGDRYGDLYFGRIVGPAKFELTYPSGVRHKAQIEVVPTGFKGRRLSAFPDCAILYTISGTRR